MAKGITEKEPDPRVVYADIIDLPHWQSLSRPHMSLYARSAQFAPFAALSGYDEMIVEEGHETDTRVELEDWELEQLNQKLTLIADVLEDGNKPRLTFTVFVPDERKHGGSYIEVTDTVKRIDAAARKVVLMSEKDAVGYKKDAVGYKASGMNKTIDFDKIVAIHGDLVDYMDNPDPT
ncbi:hypothetical protein [Enterocloster lavalensis]|uniref:hypothetical protein n=1 Tax=Enterocloster lavalensis TaxID=460384 RepID=UPI001D08CB50|nr:hypothetical protein [Enterocloster lavalensis]MCB6346991.1 hypothetical protein [Enterocloster lavalensis]